MRPYSIKRRFLYVLCLGCSLIATAYVSGELFRLNLAEYEKPWQDWLWQRPIPSPQMQEASNLLVLKETLEKYRSIVSLEPENWVHWEEMGELLLDLAQNPAASRQEREEAISDAEKCLRNAIQRFPTRSSSRISLAHLLSRQRDKREADRQMATAQLLGVDDPETVLAMARYWMRRYLKETDDAYLYLLAHRLLLLNTFSFAKYGEKTLEIWETVAPHIHPWGTIFAKEDAFAWQIASFYFKRGQLSHAKEYLGYIQGESYTGRTSFLRAEIALEQKRFPEARDLYKKCLTHTGKEEKEKQSLTIGKSLVQANRFDEAISMLKEAEANTPSNRLALLEYSVELGMHSTALPLLEEMALTGEESARFHFLLSKASWPEKKIENALAHAQKAFLQEPRNDAHARHLFEILLSLGMEEKAVYYLLKYEDAIPSPASFHAMIAEHYFHRKQISKAWEYIQKAARLDPGDKRIQNRLQTLYFSFKKAKTEHEQR